MKKRVATWAILIFAFCGLADSAYITQHEMTGTPLICDIRALTGCNVVAQSPYAYLFGIPIAEYGILFYGVLFLVAAFELLVYHHLARRVMQAFSIVGFIMSLYFVALQIFVIKALCIYCLASAALVLLIFICSFFLEPIGVSSASRTAPPSPPRPYLSMPPSA